MRHIALIILVVNTSIVLGQEVLVIGQSEKVKYNANDEFEELDSTVYIFEPGRECFCDDIEVYFDSAKKTLAYKSYNESDTCHTFNYWRNGSLKKHVIYIPNEYHKDISVWWWYEAYCSNGQVLYKGPSDNQSKRFKSVTYYCNGQKRREFIREGEGAVGEITFWYPNGKLKEIWNFENWKMEGEWKYYDENGKLTKTEFYDQGKLIETKKY